MNELRAIELRGRRGNNIHTQNRTEILGYVFILII